MIPYEEAIRRIIDACEPLPSTLVDVDEAIDRVLTSDVVSAADLPPFDNSAMDGFALDTSAGVLPPGAELTVAGSRAAGDMAHDAGGMSCEIMTGARVPLGLDAVIPVEQVTVLDRTGQGEVSRIRLESAVAAGANIRRTGQDVRHGEVVLHAGQRLCPASHMLLAALGVPAVPVVARVPVAVITTGRELVDDPAQVLASGEIRNSNGPFLADRLAEADAAVVYRQTVGDDIAPFLESLQQGIDRGAGVVISTGAVSMGRHDFVPEALRAVGARVIFHKVAIRPGKPLLFARLSDGQLFFGIPGNPVSAAVAMRFFVEPALRAMQGRAPTSCLQLPLARPLETRAGFRYLLKARVHLDSEYRLRVDVLDGQESFRIRPLVAANAWAIIPEDASRLAAGTVVQVVDLDGRGIRIDGSGDGDGT
ncbi:MAG: molybdopterin molybdotransferase MoeA [Xanthomonadales bacterium]|nr:molybdopterin molybdotransferase MoeA [Xanthomonadales bacterium]